MRWGGGSGSGRGGEGSATFLATAGASRQEDSADASSLASIMWIRACRWRVGPERPRRASARAASILALIVGSARSLGHSVNFQCDDFSPQARHALLTRRCSMSSGGGGEDVRSSRRR